METLVRTTVTAEIRENAKLKSEGKSRVCAGKSRVLEVKKGLKPRNLEE